MQIGITSIQRNRNPWIVEWLAFHLMVGFTQINVYVHKTSDGMDQTLLALAQHYPINVIAIDTDIRPQIVAYEHSCQSFCQQVDWMAFIDGDEFLFPTQQATMAEALAPYVPLNLSALAVYWMCYGSSGHVDEPAGLLMENFPRHASLDFLNNRHIKSIVRGGLPLKVASAHTFDTVNGTFDEKLRPVTWGLMPDYQPSYEAFRINHYATQSYGYYMQQKIPMGLADRDVFLERPESYFFNQDRNECCDGMSYNFLVRLKLKVRELQRHLG